MKHLIFTLLLFCAIPLFAQTAEEFSAVERMANELAIELECDAQKQADFYLVKFGKYDCFDLIKKAVKNVDTKNQDIKQIIPWKRYQDSQDFYCKLEVQGKDVYLIHNIWRNYIGVSHKNYLIKAPL